MFFLLYSKEIPLHSGRYADFMFLRARVCVCKFVLL